MTGRREVMLVHAAIRVLLVDFAYTQQVYTRRRDMNTGGVSVMGSQGWFCSSIEAAAANIAPAIGLCISGHEYLFFFFPHRLLMCRF